jgi:hypothetical protein
MNCTPLARRRRLAVVLLLAAPTLAAAALRLPLPARVPATLDPGPSARLALTLAARGVQVYTCRPQANTPNGLAWAFVAPDAELFDNNGERVGRHGAGPYWQADDGSRVEGRGVQARADAPSGEDIPWLMLGAQADADGVFGRVSRVLRVNTQGGSAPRQACTHSGQVAQVPYRADYHFYTERH